MSITRISVGPGGVQANGPSYAGAAPTFSGDGRFFVFESNASNLVPGDTNGKADVFVLDRQTGSISRVSTSSSGGQLGGQSFDGTISADGRYLAFATSDSAFTGGSGWAVVRKDLQTGAVQSAGSAYVQGISENPHEPQLSADGRYVAYNGPGRSILRHDFQTGTTDTVVDGEISGSPAISADGRYVTYFSGVYGAYLTYVKDMATGSLTSLVNTGFNFEQQISADGRYVIYQTTHNVVSGDTNGVADIIRYDRQTGESLRVNTDSTGAQAVGDHSLAPMMSNDGRYIVFFSLATNLAAGDTNGRHDVFVKDMVTGRLELVSKSAAGIPANGTSGYSSISADGRFVTFSSDAPDLVEGDTNGAKDVFIVDLAATGFWQGQTGPIEITPAGSSIVVNTAVAGTQHEPGVLALSNGTFLATWTDLSASQRKAQIFDQSGNKIGGEINLFSDSHGGGRDQFVLADGRAVVYTVGAGLGRIVGIDGQPDGPAFSLIGGVGYHTHAVLTGGGFVLADSVNNYRDVGVQAYDASGNKVGPLTAIPSGTYNEFVVKELVGLSNGGFMLLYKQPGGGLAARTFDANGAQVATNLDVSPLKSDVVWAFDIDSVLMPDGRVLVAWSQFNPPSGTTDIFARFLNADGSTNGDTFLVNATTAGNQTAPKLQLTSTGAVAVAWFQGDYRVAWDAGSNASVHLQMLNSDGSKLGTELVLSSSPPSHRSLFMTDTLDGGVFATWRAADGSGFAVRARHVLPDGTAGSDEMLVNTATSGNQYPLGVAATADGTILVVFTDDGGADGSGVGVLAQRFVVNGVAPPVQAAPIDITLSTGTVEENTAPGSIVGTLTATDANAGDTHTFALTSDPSGFFEIVGNQVRVKSGATLDYETATSHALTITATDQTGRAYSKTLTVAVDNVSGTVTGTAAGETLAGTSEEDVISGLGGDDRLLGSAGADKLDGGAGTDTADYSTAASGLTVSLAHVDRNTGEAAGDTYVSIERLVGSYHADVLYGNRWTSTEIDGGAGDDRLFGFGDSDTLLGNLGTDRLYGGDGGDILIGGQDYDVLYGEGGDDLLDGVDGETVKVADHLVGGLGDDHYIVDGDTVIEAAGQGFDTVETRSSMTLRAGAEIEFLLGTTSAATKLVGNEFNQDIVDLSGRAAELRGMGGADYLEGNAGSDTLWGDFGGGTGIGVAGNDELRGGAGNDWLYGEGGDDQLFGEGDNDRLYAGAGNDFSYGGAGDDILYGEAGNDTLSGGRGVDLLSGGEGADTFVYATGDGNDVIFDFSVSDGDKVSLVGVTFVSGAYAGTAFAELSDGALLRAVNGHVWTSGDFIV